MCIKDFILDAVDQRTSSAAGQLIRPQGSRSTVIGPIYEANNEKGQLTAEETLHSQGQATEAAG